VRRWDATRLAPNRAGRGEAFDIAFLDPPYARGLAAPALNALREGAWLAPGALAVVERGADEFAFDAPGYAVIDSRAWGAARVCFMRLEAADSSVGA
jgi:16S rRNA (guanine966-N2)-methyltransferase